jgi:hypothetical protein
MKIERVRKAKNILYSAILLNRNLNKNAGRVKRK